MRICIIAFTAEGGRLSLKIKEMLEGLKAGHVVESYVYEKYKSGGAIAFTKGSVLVSKLFKDSDAMIFVGAVGIAVRLIAPFISSKQKDPAVVSVDEQGRFAIALLSGHIGGGNKLAEMLAKGMGAVPVITTATDVSGHFSPDNFAMANDLHICDTEAAKKVAAAALNGERVGICIAEDDSSKPYGITLNLIPKDIYIGVGCKRDTPFYKLESYILDKLNEYNIDVRRIKAMGSIDLKKNEGALIDFSHKYDIAFKTFSSTELNAQKGDFTASSFVSEVTGTDNVCERSAVALGGELIIKKQAKEGMTFAAARRKMDIDIDKEWHRWQ